MQLSHGVWTILEVTEILCSFRLVLKARTLSDAEGNTFGLLNGDGVEDLHLLRTLLAIHQKFREPSFWEVTDFFVFISICMCGSFKNSFATITSLSELYFRFRRFTLLLQTKKEISIYCGSSTSSWKPWRWVRFDLMLSMWDIYINSNLNPLTKLNSSSSRSTELSSHGPSLKWSQRFSQSAWE